MIERYGSGSPFEAQVGYCRVVRAGDMLHVAGCTSTGEDGIVLYPGDAYEQARQALTNVGMALSLAGATFADVVRTRIYVTDISRWEESAVPTPRSSVRRRRPRRWSRSPP